MSEILDKEYLGKDKLEEETKIQAEDYFLDPTSLRVAAAMYNWELRDKSKDAEEDDDEELGSGTEGSGNPEPDPDPELKPGQESILQLWGDGECKANNTVVICETKRKAFNPSKFLPLSDF